MAKKKSKTSVRVRGTKQKSGQSFKALLTQKVNRPQAASNANFHSKLASETHSPGYTSEKAKKFIGEQITKATRAAMASTGGSTKKSVAKAKAKMKTQAARKKAKVAAKKNTGSARKTNARSRSRAGGRKKR